MYLSAGGVLYPSEAQVALGPAGVDAVHLQLGELEGGVEGLSTDPDHDGVDGQRDALHHLLGKAILTADTGGGAMEDSEREGKMNNSAKRGRDREVKKQTKRHRHR